MSLAVDPSSRGARRLRSTAAFLCLAVILAQCPVVAWGNVAHRAIARLAAQRLSERARSEVTALLGTQTLVDVALWADEVRNTTHPQTYNWHFTNIPISSSGYVRARDCRPSPRGDCVVAAIERLEVQLRTNTSRQARREALQFLVHLIGDVHQPLHAAQNNDLGGNNRRIVPIGNSETLHSAWDSGIIRASGRNENALVNAANQWLRTQNEAQLAAGAPADWANEGFRLARDVAYREVQGDNAITNTERIEAIGLVEKKVARAGVRLAATLNRAFAGGVTNE
jgi:hypothetical protein